MGDGGGVEESGWCSWRAWASQEVGVLSRRDRELSVSSGGGHGNIHSSLLLCGGQGVGGRAGFSFQLSYTRFPCKRVKKICKRGWGVVKDLAELGC